MCKGCKGMSRLIALGCSNTYGQGLHDCYLKGGPGPHPSKYAWPARLGEMLDKEAVNLGQPGASNRYIWHKALTTDFELDDIVVLHWTLIHRHAVIYNDHTYLNLGIWYTMDRPVSDHWKKYIAAVDDDYDMLLESCICIDHANKYLENRVGKIVNIVFNDQEFDNLPSWCDFKFDLSAAPFNLDYPLALDDAHTGPRGHKELAKAIKELL